MTKETNESDKMTKEKLLALLKSKLNSTGKNSSGDETDIYGNDKLNLFLDLSLSEFNSTHCFTNYSFNNMDEINVFSDVLVEGAFLHALSYRALVEAEKDLSTRDNGIIFSPPTFSDMLFKQFCTISEFHYRKLKDIKNSFSASNKIFQIKE